MSVVLLNLEMSVVLLTFAKQIIRSILIPGNLHSLPYFILLDDFSLGFNYMILYIRLDCNVNYMCIHEILFLKRFDIKNKKLIYFKNVLSILIAHIMLG